MVTAWIFAHSPNIAKVTDPTQAPELSTAITKLVSGQYADAQRTLEQLVAGQPMSSDAHYWLGLAYLKNNQPLMARRQFIRSVALGRGSSAARQANNYLLGMTNGPPNRMPRGKRSVAPPADPPAVKPSTAACGMADGKPAVFAFYATWCEQCNRLDDLIKHGESVYGNKVKFLKIDVDDPKNQNLVQDFKVGPIPTLIYLKKDGSVASTSIGESGFANFTDGLTALVR
jgi:thioredoxin-like negative regulator of GroEL